MTGEVVNLRRIRKARARQAAEAVAAENRVRFGRSKAVRAASVAEVDRVARIVDGARLEP